MPERTEYPQFYQTYIDVLKPKSQSLVESLEDSLQSFHKLLIDLKKEQWEYRYAEGKWTVKEIVQHLIDAERVFAYRALRFARKDQTELPGFDENHYVEACHANARDHENLLKEFILLRNTTILLFRNFDKETLGQKGPVDGKHISVRALGFICSGHLQHHINVIRDRYLGES